MHLRRVPLTAGGPMRSPGPRLRTAAASVGSGRRECLLMGGAYGLYGLVKGLRGGALAEGRANAAAVVRLERRLRIHTEAAWQRFFTRHRLGMPFWNLTYLASQVVAMPLSVFLVYRLRRERYPFMRNMALLSWTAGVGWYALQPVAPPRLMGGPVIDTVSTQTPFDLDSRFARAFYNPVAAMPSLHVGMSPVVAWALWRLSPWRLTRLLGLAYPGIVTVAIVVTGNHWWLDAAGGLLVVLPAAAIAAWSVREPAPARRWA